VAYSTPRIAAIEYLRVVMLPTVEQVRTIGVIGAGTMGHGIAHVGALRGAQVHLYDAMRGAAQAGIAKIAKNLDRASSLANYSKPRATRRSHSSPRSMSWPRRVPTPTA
jgi:hypothetical protein